MLLCKLKRFGYHTRLYSTCVLAVLDQMQYVGHSIEFYLAQQFISYFDKLLIIELSILFSFSNFSDPNVGWQGQHGGAGPQQSLSVVTTVWGVTPTTQTTPYNHTTPGGYNTNTTMSNTSYTQPPQGFPGNQMQKPGYESNTGLYQRSNSYPCPR